MDNNDKIETQDTPFKLLKVCQQIIGANLSDTNSRREFPTVKDYLIGHSANRDRIIEKVNFQTTITNTPQNPLLNCWDRLKNMLPHNPELGNKVNREFSAATAGLVDGKFVGPPVKFSSLVDVENKKYGTRILGVLRVGMARD
jgi:hypothetical protein